MNFDARAILDSGLSLLLVICLVVNVATCIVCLEHRHDISAAINAAIGGYNLRSILGELLDLEVQR